MERKPKYVLSSYILEKKRNRTEDAMAEVDLFKCTLFYTCNFVNIKMFDVNMNQI